MRVEQAGELRPGEQFGLARQVVGERQDGDATSAHARTARFKLPPRASAALSVLNGRSLVPSPVSSPRLDET